MKNLDGNILSCCYTDGRFLLTMSSKDGVYASVELNRKWMDHLKREVDRAIETNECEIEAQRISQQNALPTLAEIRGEASVSDFAEGRVP